MVYLQNTPPRKSFIRAAERLLLAECSDQKEASFSMPSAAESRHVKDIVVVVPLVRGDSRGFFMETCRADQFREIELPTEIVQDNHSRSSKDVLRGSHFQWEGEAGIYFADAEIEIRSFLCPAVEDWSKEF